MVFSALRRYTRRSQANRSSMIVLPDRARAMGVFCAAGKGSGKSRLAGRVICFQDLLKGRAQIVLDPMGATIDNLLDVVNRQPNHVRAEALERIIYVDMSGKSGHIVAWPLYYRYPDESLYEAAVRLVEVIRRLDPALASASIEGLNALMEIGIYAGMVATALGWQIMQVQDLIASPERFTRELHEVASTYPEAAQATHYFLQVLPSLKPAEKERKVGAFLRKIAIFSLEPTLRAMTGSDRPRIDWQSVVDEGKTVLLDFRGVIDSERRRFLMLWSFREFLTFVKRRGVGRHTPVSLMVDELTALYNFDAQAGSSIFASDLDELVNILARNFQVWLFLAIQEIFQVDEKSRKTLLTMGTKILGVTTDTESALALAQALIGFDPSLIKYFEPIYDMRGTVIDVAPQYWTIQEQQLLAARTLQTLKPFHFLVAISQREGNAAVTLQPMSIEGVDAGIWVDEVAVVGLRLQLASRSGASPQALAAPQATRVGNDRQPSHSPSEHDRLEVYAETSDDDFSFFVEPHDNEIH